MFCTNKFQDLSISRRLRDSQGCRFVFLKEMLIGLLLQNGVAQHVMNISIPKYISGIIQEEQLHLIDLCRYYF